MPPPAATLLLVVVALGTGSRSICCGLSHACASAAARCDSRLQDATTGVRQYHAGVYTSADVAACWYNADHHGYELLETIGGTVTKFNVAHGII